MVEVIQKVSFRYAVDVVVMGTHGASGYRDGFIGSNTYNTIKYVGCPVLTVALKRKTISFKKLLFSIRPVSGALRSIAITSKVINNNASVDILGLSYQQLEVDINILDKIVEEI